MTFHTTSYIFYTRVNQSWSSSIDTEKAKTGNFSLLPPANVVCEGYIFTGVCDSVNRGGMRGFIRGHAWFYLGGIRGFIHGGHAWFYLGGHAWFYLGGVCGFIWGACVVLFGGCAWFYSGGACVVFSVFSDTMRYGQ